MSDTITTARLTTNGIVIGDTTISFDNHRTTVLGQIKDATDDQPFQLGDYTFRVRTGEATLLLETHEDITDACCFWEVCSTSLLKDEVNYILGNS